MATMRADPRGDGIAETREAMALQRTERRGQSKATLRLATRSNGTANVKTVKNVKKEGETTWKSR